jgi:hypothetical protein
MRSTFTPCETSRAQKVHDTQLTGIITGTELDVSDLVIPQF